MPDEPTYFITGPRGLPQELSGTLIMHWCAGSTFSEVEKVLSWKGISITEDVWESIKGHFDQAYTPSTVQEPSL